LFELKRILLSGLAMKPGIWTIKAVLSLKLASSCTTERQLSYWIITRDTSSYLNGAGSAADGVTGPG